jgi:hypothetical protein
MLSITRVFLAAVLLLAVIVPVMANAEEGADIPADLREQLETLLEARVKELGEEPADDDSVHIRGNFCHRFHPTDDGGYNVMLTKDTAWEGNLLCERYLVTLAEEGAGGWHIKEESREATYGRMVREIPGDEQFRTFESFAIDTEGMKLSASNGTMIFDYLEGELNQIIFTGADLAYEYSPPPDLSYYREGIYEHLQERHKEDFLFNPELVVIDCDGGTCKLILQTSFTGVAESTEEALPPALRKFYNEAIEKENKARRENPFSGFDVPLEPERKIYQIAIKRQGKDKWLALRYDNDEAWDVTFYASDYGPLFGYITEAARKTGIRPYDIEARDDRTAKDFEIEAFKGSVELAIEHSEVMNAEVEYTLNMKRDRHELPFSLTGFRGFGGKVIPGRDPSMEINSMRTAEGQELSWYMTGAAKGFVIFPETVKAGTQLRLQLDFKSRNSIAKVTPSYSYMDRSGWLPFMRFTDRIDEFELTVKVPSKYTVLGVGTKVSEETKRGINTTHWKAESPVAFPTIIFGDYYSIQPKIKATRMDGSEIPVTVWADKDGMAQRDIRPKQLETLGEQAVNSLNLFREIYGFDYPYGKLDLVSDPVGLIGPLYGQAPSSLIFVGWAVFRGEGMLGDATGEAELTKAVRSLVSHEVGHEWWGHVISNANMRNYWFIETFTEYSSALFVEAVNSDGGKDPEKGYKAYLDKVNYWRDAVLENDLVVSVQDASALYSGEDGFGSYVAAVYNKGPYALHTLRVTFGAEKVYEFLRRLMHEFADREIVARDIEAIAELTFGGNMAWFFDQWFRGVGMPEFSFNYDYRRTEDRQYLVEGSIKQRVLFGKQKELLEGVFFRGVVPITVVGKDREEYTIRVVVEGEQTPFTFKLPVEPREVTLNKYGEMLAHDVLENR